MPIYVYRNLATGETFEMEQRISDAPLSAHPETGEPVKRLIQPVAVAFKGSGFYVTDSRKDAGKGSSTPKGSETSESKAESKPETKPEKKAESKPAAAND